MVVLDFSNAEIARKLVVTESNVKNHLTSAFSKLGVTSRNEAAELILDPDSGLGPGSSGSRPRSEAALTDWRARGARAIAPARHEAP